ncbi:hypothetical protein AAY51_23945, partial [Vibrio parahaemolyticus]
CVGALVGWHYWNNHHIDAARRGAQSSQTVVTSRCARKAQDVSAADTLAADTKDCYGAVAWVELAQPFVDEHQRWKAAAPVRPGV